MRKKINGGKNDLANPPATSPHHLLVDPELLCFRFFYLSGFGVSFHLQQVYIALKKITGLTYILMPIYRYKHITWKCVRSKSLQSCLTLCDSTDCSLPGFSVHGILQTRILEWVAMPSFRGSSWPGDWTTSPEAPHCRQILYHWAIGEACITSER